MIVAYVFFTPLSVFIPLDNRLGTALFYLLDIVVEQKAKVGNERYPANQVSLFEVYYL